MKATPYHWVIKMTTEVNTTKIEDEDQMNRSDMATPAMLQALLADCPKCGEFLVHVARDALIERTLNEGSKRAPLRTWCTKCGSHFRMVRQYGKPNQVYAIIPVSKRVQVAHLRDVATAANMEETTSTKDLYEYWKQNTGFHGKGVPIPFKRWNKRSGGSQ